MVVKPESACKSVYSVCGQVNRDQQVPVLILGEHGRRSLFSELALDCSRKHSLDFHYNVLFYSHKLLPTRKANPSPFQQLFWIKIMEQEVTSHNKRVFNYLLIFLSSGHMMDGATQECILNYTSIKITRNVAALIFFKDSGSQLSSSLFPLILESQVNNSDLNEEKNSNAFLDEFSKSRNEE